MRTSALRLSVVYAAIFAAALLALVFVIYLLTARFIDTEVDAAIERDTAGFLEAYARGGVRTLAAELTLRSENWSRTNAVYLLTDSQGFVLAGNLPAWPTMHHDNGPWVDFVISVQEGGVEIERPIRAMVLEPSRGLRFLVGTDLSERYALVRRFAVAAGVGSLLVTILALGIGYRQSQRILARVADVSRSCAEILGGNLSRRLPVVGADDEFDTLAGEVNALLARLARTTEILRASLHSAAHDLRSPMHRMRLRMERALADPDPVAGASRETVEVTLQDLDHMQRVLTALLQIAEAESGAVGARPEAVAMDVLLAELVELYQPQAEQQGIVLGVSLESGRQVMGHRQLLAQAVANLIDNALKFTPAGGSVQLAAHADGTRLVLTVADTGPGIPAEERGRAVEPFVRLNETPSRDGSGLGLSLAAAVARLHGGSLRLADNQPGLLVTIDLPLV
ncbi:MAG: HAMP domain-containing sensor histidine kinase [Gammaproteobacteria bacterium]